MKEYVESAKDADKLEEKAQALAEAVGLDEPGEFGAKYIENVVITASGYTVHPCSGTADYAVVEEMSEVSGGGMVGGISPGPVTELRENGFIVKEVKAYVNEDTVLIDADLPECFAVAYVGYIGSEHPIIEYWDE